MSEYKVKRSSFDGYQGESLIDSAQAAFVLRVVATSVRPSLNLGICEIAQIRLSPIAPLREEIETSILVEPSVLTLYAVTIKGEPNQIRLFEMYASQAAYQAHLQSEHFRKYKTTTADMVKSRRLIETEPLLLGTK